MNKTMDVKTIKLALPKGSLQQSTLNLLEKAGYKFTVGSRQYYADCNDPEIEALLIRPQEMPRYVADGVFDGFLAKPIDASHLAHLVNSLCYDAALQ